MSSRSPLPITGHMDQRSRAEFEAVLASWRAAEANKVEVKMKAGTFVPARTPDEQVRAALARLIASRG